MVPCLLRKLRLNSCIVTVLVTVLLVVRGENIEHTEWKPIQWYVAGNITFGTAISKLNDHRANFLASWNGSGMKYSNQGSIYKAKDGYINREEEISPESVNWQETSRTLVDERLGDIVQSIWTTEENSGDSMEADTKEEEEEQSRKKKKKLLKKLALPLLVLYKIKFLMLIPVLVASMVLLSGSSGLAGFFFAMFAAMMAYGKEH